LKIAQKLFETKKNTHSDKEKCRKKKNKAFILRGETRHHQIIQGVSKKG